MREWVRLYTSAPRHPKMLRISLEAKGLYWDCLGYSASTEDESFVPEAYVTHVTRDAVTATTDLVQALVDVRLWEPCEDGWTVHNFEERQGVESARKEAARIRQQRHRERVKRDISVTVTPVTRDESVTSHREEKKEKREEENVPDGTSAVAERVFEVWRVERNHLQARLIEQRRRVVRARLRDGYTEADLIAAIRGVALDPWPERVRHDDLTQILRDGAHVEKFRAMWQEPHPVVAIRRNPLDEQIANFGRRLEVTA